jgi:hypothetical protein
MARCEMCGNDYDKAFTVTMPGVTTTCSTVSSARCTPWHPRARTAAAG